MEGTAPPLPAWGCLQMLVLGVGSSLVVFEITEEHTLLRVRVCLRLHGRGQILHLPMSLSWGFSPASHPCHSPGDGAAPVASPQRCQQLCRLLTVWAPSFSPSPCSKQCQHQHTGGCAACPRSLWQSWVPPWAWGSGMMGLPVSTAMDARAPFLCQTIPQPSPLTLELNPPSAGMFCEGRLALLQLLNFSMPRDHLLPHTAPQHGCVCSPAVTYLRIVCIQSPAWNGTPVQLPTAGLSLVGDAGAHGDPKEAFPAEWSLRRSGRT